jgi:hypothetical protein
LQARGKLRACEDLVLASYRHDERQKQAAQAEEDKLH